MKMVLAVVNDQIAAGLIEKLLKKNFRVTRMTSSGGFLRRGNTTLFCGVDDEEVQVVIQIIKDYAERKKLEKLEDMENKQKTLSEGLATIFVVPVERMLHL